MGQKSAAYDTTGAIVGFYDSIDSPLPTTVTSYIDITDDEWLACLAAPGYTVVNGALVAPAEATAAELLADAQVSKKSVLTTDCQSAIVSGYTSSALGTAHNYPSALQDQINQNSIAHNSAGGDLWCETGDTWALTTHTQDQAVQAVADFSTWLNACQAQLVTLSAEVSGTLTVSGVEAIVWSDPT